MNKKEKYGTYPSIIGQQQEPDPFVERFSIGGYEEASINEARRLVALLEERGQRFKDDTIHDYAWGFELLQLAAYCARQGQDFLHRLYLAEGGKLIKEAAKRLKLSPADLPL